MDTNQWNNTGLQNEPQNEQQNGQPYETQTYAYQTQANMTSPVIEEKRRGLGVVGALLGALAGGVIWAVVCCRGYISGWVSAVILLLARAGYKKLAKVEDTFGNVISLILGILVIFPAAYFSNGFFVWRVMVENISSNFTYWEITKDLPLYLSRYDLWPDVIFELVLGVVVVAIVGLGMFFSERKKSKTENIK